MDIRGDYLCRYLRENLLKSYPVVIILSNSLLKERVGDFFLSQKHLFHKQDRRIFPTIMISFYGTSEKLAHIIVHGLRTDCCCGAFTACGTITGMRRVAMCRAVAVTLIFEMIAPVYDII